MKKILVFLTFAFCLLPFKFAFAASPAIEITSLYQIADKDAVDGDIISNTDKGLVRSANTEDIHMFGVVTDNPLAVWKETTATGSAIARSGIVEINVIDLDGPIKKGDYVTSSDTAGKGKKAVKSGYVVGTALTDASDGRTQVALRIEYAEVTTPRSANRLFEMLGATFF